MEALHRNGCVQTLFDVITSPEMVSLFTLQKLELLIKEFGELVVSIPEFKLLQQYHVDTVSWISRFNNVLLKTNEQEHEENVVEELRRIQKDGSGLRVQGQHFGCTILAWFT